MNKQKPNILDKMQEAMRLKHNVLKTEKSYVHWIHRFIYFHHLWHPQGMGAAENQPFLNHLAIDQHVALPPKTRHLMI